MSHLDEGQLHAYLDAGAEAAGAETHLATCAECRAKLEEARGLRDRARAILLRGGPDLAAAPPFEEITRRKVRVTPRRAPRTLALAWAATVALALGIGWYARSLALRDPSATLDVAARPIIAQAPSRETREPATAPAEPARQLADRVAVVPTAEAPAAARTAADSLREVDAARNTRDLARVMVEPASRPSAAGAQPGRAQPVAAATDEVELWVPANRAEAERRLDDQLAALPDLETVGITVRRDIGAAETRTVQRLPDGRMIELIQQRLVAAKREAIQTAERSAAGAARAAAEAPTTAVVEWSNSRVVARSELPADSLRALLRQLRRAPPER